MLSCGCVCPSYEITVGTTLDDGVLTHSGTCWIANPAAENRFAMAGIFEL